MVSPKKRWSASPTTTGTPRSVPLRLKRVCTWLGVGSSRNALLRSLQRKVLDVSDAVNDDAPPAPPVPEAGLPPPAPAVDEDDEDMVVDDEPATLPLPVEQASTPTTSVTGMDERLT